MKKLITICILLIVIKNAAAQIPNLKIDNGNFVYEKVFNQELLSATKIDSMLQQYLPTQKGVSNLKSNNSQITASFQNLFINYKKYDAHNGSLICNAPLNANITIQIKEGKYKVLVNSIVITTTGPTLGSMQMITQTSSAESLFLKNNQTEFRTNSGIEKMMDAIQQQFTDMFTIKQINNDW